VYLHGLIRDEHGQKMSKSKGNVIDPLELMDELGTDAMRFTLLVGSTPGNDMNLSPKKVEANRNFANKVWNIGRFVWAPWRRRRTSLQGEPEWTLADSWIWARLQRLEAEVERLFQNYQFGEAGRQIYEFMWGDFADWYLEISKLQMNAGGDRAFTPLYPGAGAGRLPAPAASLHAFCDRGTVEPPQTGSPIPFPAWRLEWRLGRSADRRPLAAGAARGGLGESRRLRLSCWCRTWSAIIRNMRTEKKVTPGKKMPALIAAGERLAVLEAQRGTIAALAHLDPDALELSARLAQKPQGAASSRRFRRRDLSAAG
jgi:valyl-tRNA synthetase